MKNNRIIGFDVARAYAIFGMYIVNLNFCFGSFQDASPLGRFLSMFVGNSTSIFIILAGMGLSFMSNRGELDAPEKQRLKSIVLKRSWFLFVLGLSLYNWWPGDILHFYGGYMHIAALMLFVPKRIFLWVAAAAIAVYHGLMLVIPVTTSWDLATFNYADFWTPTGFVRNTLYNGWNSIFPWLAFFMLGMWLGRLDWQNKVLRVRVFWVGLALFSVVKAARILFIADLRNAERNWFCSKYWDYFMADYFPAYLPFMLITGGFALMSIPLFMVLGERFSENPLVRALGKTGRMTLTHYVSHLTLGIVIFSCLTGKEYTGLLAVEMPESPAYILMFACLFFVASVIFSVLWGKKFKNGPLESLMRRLSDK